MTNPAEMINRSEEQKSKKRGLASLVVAGTLAATLCMGGVFAYLTATDSVTNTFGLTDSHSIEVVEPNWDTTDEDGNGVPDALEATLPGQVVAKDPQVKNLKDFDAYVFLEVQVPTKNVQLEGEDAASLHELFSYDVNEGWSEYTFVEDEDGGHWEKGAGGKYDATTGMTTHTYLYDEAVAGNATSGALFDEVTVANYINDQLGGDMIANIQIDGHSIQALGFDGPAAAWAAYTAQNA